jgi:hypothetical protein
MLSVQPERPRARRYPFVANIELISLDSEAENREKTIDLSLFGCRVTTVKPWALGTKVRIRITYRGATFTALSRIAHLRTNAGMGVVFTHIEQKDQLVLEKWIAETRDACAQASQSD